MQCMINACAYISRSAHVCIIGPHYDEYKRIALLVLDDVLVTFNILSIYVGNEGIFLIICDLITSCMSSYNTCAKGKRANDAEGVPP